MKRLTFFDGLNFHFFGINKNCSLKTKINTLFYSLQYIHSGEILLQMKDGRTHHLYGPVLFLNSPELNIKYESPENTRRNHYFVCFSGDRVKRYIESGLFCLPEQLPYVKISSPEQFLSNMLELILLLQNKSRHEFAVAKLEYILLLLHKQEIQENIASYHQRSLELLTQNIMTSPEQDWDFKAEADKMNISLKHFMRLFQKFHHGIPPCRFVLQQRLSKAGEMLIQRKDSIKTIAYECGFRNEFYFSRAFKKYMQHSPAEYRNKNLYTMGSFDPAKYPEQTRERK